MKGVGESLAAMSAFSKAVVGLALLDSWFADPLDLLISVGAVGADAAGEGEAAEGGSCESILDDADIVAEVVLLEII